MTAKYPGRTVHILCVWSKVMDKESHTKHTPSYTVKPYVTTHLTLFRQVQLIIFSLSTVERIVNDTV